jgi:hypothetical protein
MPGPNSFLYKMWPNVAADAFAMGPGPGLARARGRSSRPGPGQLQPWSILNFRFLFVVLSLFPPQAMLHAGRAGNTSNKQIKLKTKTWQQHWLWGGLGDGGPGYMGPESLKLSIDHAGSTGVPLCLCLLLLGKPARAVSKMLIILPCRNEPRLFMGLPSASLDLSKKKCVKLQLKLRSPGKATNKPPSGPTQIRHLSAQISKDRRPTYGGVGGEGGGAEPPSENYREASKI